MELTKNLPDGTSYRVVGKGHPCMLLHGFAEDGHIWDEQVNALQDIIQFFIPDMPGIGASIHAFPNTSITDFEGCADVIRQIADLEGIGSMVILGHSMGGYITLAVVEKYPDLVKAFGLIHSTSYADNEEKLLTRRKSVALMKSNGNGLKLFLSQLYPNLYGERYKRESYGEIEKQIKASELFKPEVLIAQYEMMMKRPDRRTLLEGCEKPVLFVIGAEDKTVNLSDSLAQCHLPLESHIHILEQAGHMGMKEEPLKTTKAIGDFLTYINENE